MNTEERKKLEAEALQRLQGLSKEELLEMAISNEVAKVEYAELSKECFANTERYKILVNLANIGGFADIEEAIKTALDYGLADYLSEVSEVFLEVKEWAEACGIDTSKGFDLCGSVYQFLGDKIANNLQDAGIEICEIPIYCNYLDSFFNIDDDFLKAFKEAFEEAVRNDALNLEKLETTSLRFLNFNLNYSLESLEELQAQIKS